MPRVQLAVQGGGAKVFALLAALDSVQQLVRAGKLEVTRIAGTSAGAIAASLFAAGVDLAGLRHELPTLGGGIIRELGAPSFLDFVRAATGRPIWSMGSLAGLMDKLLGRTGVRSFEDTVGKTGTELLIVSSDLHELKRVEHRKGFITNAVLDSCGIPFCFRTWKEPRANFVDGGICENLPVESLVNEEGTYGTVIGISFERIRPERPENIRAFSAALLDAAIDNSVERAIRRIGTERVLSLGCPFGTFDFDAALKDGTGPYYDLVVKQTESFFRTFLDPEDIPVGDPWESGDHNNMLRIGEMYEKQHRKIPLKRHRTMLDITVQSLDRQGTPDIVLYSSTLSAINEPVFCHAIAMSSAKHKTLIEKTQLFAYNEASKERIEAIRVYMKMPSAPNLRYVLLCFVPALMPGDGPYTITSVDSVYDAMKELVTEPYVDHMSITSKRAVGQIDEVDFVVRVPAKYERARFKNKPGEKWGSEMSDFGLREKVTAGFRTIGWSGINLDSSKSWSVDVSLY